MDRLSRLADAAMDVMPDVAEFLAQELERARVIPSNKPVSHIVRMGARVEYRDEKTGKVQAVQLVYPAESDIERGLVSVLTPIGAALLGLSKGQSIIWTTRSGEGRTLTVTAVGDEAAEPGTSRETPA